VKHSFRIGVRNTSLDLVSYGRRGASRPKSFTLVQIAQIARTVRRAPEVMVKVSGGANTTKGVAAHFSYIGREPFQRASRTQQCGQIDCAGCI
jgi:hypothetical protein